ncbi:MAG: J domain-containing protein [Jiangellaceae bacterium]|jgi:hypothetical protein
MDGSGPRTHRRDAAVRNARALLGVPADADLPEITRAYWRQARTLHPDRNSDPEATQQFQALNAAYRLMVDSVLHRPPAAVVPPHEPPAPRMARPTAGGRDGVWMMAGPVHVQPARRSDTTARNPAGERP